MNYHNVKMDEINKIVRELWRNTYRGNGKGVFRDVKVIYIYCKRLFIRVNSQEHRDAKIKSSSIISIIRLI